MRVNTAKVVIVGGGLSGLYAAHLLEQRGVKDAVLLEARDALGGRIVSVPAPQNGAHCHAGRAGADGTADRFDLGPSWFWPGIQLQLGRLVQELGLTCFEQFEDGDMVLERSAAEPPTRMRGYGNEPPSMRLLGGMGALTDALSRRLTTTRIVTGQAVRRMRRVAPHVELDSEEASGLVTTWRTSHVLLALPPRLAEHTIVFEPALPSALAEQWRATATWMAPHAKYLALYDAPFWREQGLSGEARSAHGPLAEIHDAGVPGGSAALFGFFSLPADVRKGVPEDALRAHCRAQLARLFGPQAGAPKAEFFKDWAQEPCTATPADGLSTGHHTRAPLASASAGPWQGCLTGIGSEWSQQFPGYVAGAIDAANLGVQALSSQYLSALDR